MIKNLLTGVAVLSVMFSVAQSGKSFKDEGVRTKGVLNSNNSGAKTSALNCDTLYNFNLGASTTTLTIYSLNTGSTCTTGGYVCGNNCYGDAEKATFYAGSSYSSLLTPSVQGVFVMFYKNPTTGRGTKGGSTATNTMGIAIYNGSMAGGPTGSSLGTAAATMSSITAAFTSTSSLGTYYFAYTTPVAVGGTGFFASAVLPKVLGDTAVIYQQYQATTTSGWESDGSAWYDMKTNWGGTINFEMAMFPVMACGPSGVSEKEMGNYFSIVPNPSNGVFSLVSRLSNLTYNISVINALGQEIMNKRDINGAAVNEINLSDYSNGVYFINITSGSNKITKKLIINK
jgi:hypothetical protein